jgi:hypothetical protein
VSLPSPEEGNRSSFPIVVFQFLEYHTMDKGNPVILSVIHHWQNPLESADGDIIARPILVIESASLRIVQQIRESRK